MRGTIIDRDSNKLRLLQDIEFIQMLGNMDYIRYIVKHGYLKDGSFLEYVRYLTYLQSPCYSHFMTYPHTLGFLSILCDKEVQVMLVEDENQIETIIRQEISRAWAAAAERQSELYRQHNI